MKVLITQSFLTLCDSMDCSSSVYGIRQATILEWVLLFFKKKKKTLTSCLVNTRQENEEVKEITTSTQRIHPANLSESGL